MVLTLCAVVNFVDLVKLAGMLARRASAATTVVRAGCR